ncbi:hypothetical protein SMC26_18370 [Actinomadura fulvescens]|uniref:Uncharacterized protein n=1 Tax=Actinomadura fulvescens TaxID=46160 RepID=A0ABP6CPL4_9ACTN
MSIVGPLLWRHEIDQIVHAGHQQRGYETRTARQHQAAGVRGPEVVSAHPHQRDAEQQRVAGEVVPAQRGGRGATEAAA